jgi:hypothetical protein
MTSSSYLLWRNDLVKLRARMRECTQDTKSKDDTLAGPLLDKGTPPTEATRYPKILLEIYLQR